MRFSLSIIATFVAAVLAAPAQQSDCDVSNVALSLPSGLSIPKGVKPKYIALGYGTQNYTCSATGTYASAGAVAKLLDIGCLPKSDPQTFREVQSYAYKLRPRWELIEDFLKPYSRFSGNHYFIPQDGGSAPKFDFTQSGRGYVVTKKTGGASSPEGSQNVDWLELQNTSGSLAKYVFRVDTQGGQPPSSCRPGQTAQVLYTTKYWFFG